MKKISIFSEKPHELPRYTVEYSPLTYRILRMLLDSGFFSLPDCTLSVLRSVDTWCCHAVLGHRMTEENVRAWLRLRSSYSESGAWQFNVDDLQFFVNAWVDILRKTRSVMWSDTIDNAKLYLESGCAKERVERALNFEFERISDYVEDNPDITLKVYGGNVTEFIASSDLANAEPGSPVNLVSRMIFLHRKGFDVRAILGDKWQKLKADLSKIPDWFYHLEPFFPLREWARLTFSECDKLREEFISWKTKAEWMVSLERTAAL